MSKNKRNGKSKVRDSVTGRQFAEVRRGDLLSEVGIPGGLTERGLTLNSYNEDLQGPEWFRKVDEMLLASSQAAVVELCVTLPLVSAEWALKGGSKELRALTETALFGSAGMSTTWSEVLYNACSCALFGTAVFEIVWKETPAGLLFRRLVDRDPASIDHYTFDADGGLAGLVQKGLDPDTTQEVEVEIPTEKLLLFPYRKRRRGYHGRSILRPAYRHYESIAMLCTFADIGLDHSMVGLPVGKAPAGARPDDLQTFRAILAALRRHEASGLVLPPGWDLIDGRQAGGDDSIGFLPYLQWHEACFLRAALCSFMQLGSTPTGTTELGGMLMQFSLLSWGALGQFIADVVTRHAIRLLCDLNAGQALAETDYPELVKPDVRAVFANQQQAGQFLGAVASGQEQLPTDPAQRAAAVADGLTLKQQDPRATGAPAPAAAQVGAQGQDTTTGSQAGTSATPTRHHAVDDLPGRRHFGEAAVAAAAAQVRADKGAALDAFQMAMGSHAQAMIQGLLTQVDAAAEDPAKLAAVRVDPALTAAAGATLAGWLDQVYQVGAERMAQETGQAAVALTPAIAARHQALGAVQAAHLADTAQFSVITAALDGQTLQQIAQQFASTATVRLADFQQQGGQAVAAEVSRG